MYQIILDWVIVKTLNWTPRHQGLTNSGLGKVTLFAQRASKRVREREGEWETERERERRQRERDTQREKERERKKSKRESRPSSFQLIQCCHVYNTTKELDEFGQDNSGLDWTPSHQHLTNKSLVSGLGKVTCFVQGKRPRERERRPNSSQQWQCCHECNTTKVPDEFRQGYSGLSWTPNQHLTNKSLVSGLGKVTLLVQQREQTHRLGQKHVQDGTVVNVSNLGGINLFLLILGLRKLNTHDFNCWGIIFKSGRPYTE